MTTSIPLDDPLAVPDTLFNTLEDWTWIGCYGGYYLQSNLLERAGFDHGFFTRRWHGRGPDELSCYLSAGVSIHQLHQVHSNRVISASQARTSPWPDADGLVSDRGGQSLWVCGADCTPVLFADPETGHTSACHAGWRSLSTGILPKAVERLEMLGANRQHLLIAMGPAISGKNYQVGSEVSKAVANCLWQNPIDKGNIKDNLLEKISVLESTGALKKDLISDSNSQSSWLDIRLASREQLLRLGIEINQISCCPLCTFEEPTLFHSWRRDQIKAVQWSAIVAQAE